MCGGGNKTTTTAVQQANPQALGYFNQAFGLANQVSQTPTSAVPLQGVANLSPEQQQAITQTNQYSQYGIPYANQAIGMLTGAATPLTNQQIQQYENPYVSSVIGATQQQFNLQNQQALNNIQSNAAGMGATGNSRANSVAPSAYYSAVLPGQEQAIAGLEQQGYTQGLQTAQTEFQQNPQQAAFGVLSGANTAQNLGLTGANAVAGAGALQQQYGPNSQAALNALYQQNLGQFQLPFQESQLLTQAAAGLGPLYGGTSTTQAPPPNIWSQLGGIGLGVAGLGLAFSDKRLKTNIHKVGETNDGVPIYRYQFKGSPEWHVGLIAQDVEKKHPDAVHEGIGGIKMVDLKSATDDAVEKAYGGAIRGYDAGGVIPFANQSDLIQIAPISSRSGIPAAPQPPQQQNAGQTIGQQALQLASAVNKSGNAGNLGNSISTGLGNIGTTIGNAWNDLTNPPLSLAPPLGESTGGFVGEPQRDPNGIYVPQTFADGGAPDFTLDENETARLGLGQPVSWGIPDANMGSSATAYAPTSAWPTTAAFPSYAPQSAPAIPAAQSQQSGSNAPPNLIAPATTPSTPSAPMSETGAFGLPRDAMLALAMAGFGIAGGASPYAGINIGRGAVEGLQAYQAEQKQKLTFEQEAKKLAQQADQFQKSLAQQKELHMAITPYQQQELALKQRQQALAELQPVTVTDAIGMPHSMVKDPRTGQLIPYEQAVRQNGLLPSQPGASPSAGQTQPAKFQNVAWQVEPGMEYLAQPTADEIPKTANPDVLNGIDPGLAARVRAVDEGRMPLPTGAAQRMPQNIALMELLARYDPGFTAQDYASKLATRKDFTAGPTSKNITALNTVMQHVKELDGAAGDLDNWKSASLGPLTGSANALTQWYRSNEQDPRLTRFNTAANAVANELERAFRGSTTAISGIEEWRKGLNPAMSPEQWQAARGTLMKLIGGRLEALADQYNRGMGTMKDPMMMLSPEAGKAYKELQSPQRPVAQSQQSAPPPAQRQVGQTVTTSKGTFRWNGTGWDPVQ